VITKGRIVSLAEWELRSKACNTSNEDEDRSEQQYSQSDRYAADSCPLHASTNAWLDSRVTEFLDRVPVI